MKVDEQQYIFQAEKRVLDIKGLPESMPKREINTVGVIGAGTMGGGIAMNFANVGIPVHIVETNQDQLDKGLDNISPSSEIDCEILSDQKRNIKLLCRIDTIKELDYYKQGGILQYVLNSIIKKAS